MVIEGVSLVPLLKAYKKFELFRPNIATEQERAGVIHALEVTRFLHKIQAL